MKVPYGEGPASHTAPESCVAGRKARGEVLTGDVQAGLLSREISHIRGADAVALVGRQHPGPRYRERYRGPARSETLCMYASILRENREVLCSPAAGGAVGRVGKSKDVIRR